MIDSRQIVKCTIYVCSLQWSSVHCRFLILVDMSLCDSSVENLWVFWQEFISFEHLYTEFSLYTSHNHNIEMKYIVCPPPTCMHSYSFCFGVLCSKDWNRFIFLFTHCQKLIFLSIAIYTHFSPLRHQQHDMLQAVYYILWADVATLWPPVSVFIGAYLDNLSIFQPQHLHVAVFMTCLFFSLNYFSILNSLDHVSFLCKKVSQPCVTFFEVSRTVIKNVFFSQRTLQLSAQKRKLGVIKVYVFFLQ